MNYGAAVGEARRARGLTQVELAAVSGVAQANISAIENGRRQPSAETLHRLLTACGFELVATAGHRTIPLPFPLDRPPSSTEDGDPPGEAALVGPDTPPEQRARLVVAALDASEAIVRGRHR